MTNTFPKEQFEEIYKEYHTYLIRLACKYVKDENKAYDVVQEVFIKLNRQDFNKFNEIEKIRAWLSTVCRNTSFNYIRNNKKYVELDVEQENNRVSDILDPFAQLELDETKNNNQKLILKFLKQLGAKQRQCLILRFYKNKSYLEIAKQMKTNDGCVGFNINKGIAKLKELMENHLKSEKNKLHFRSKKT
jgi:RNA polymerase sigma-70 factor (ECF subfamily)